MQYTYILDDSIKGPTLILTADHWSLLFLPGFFYKIKNFFLLLPLNLYMITDTYLHDPPLFNCPFFMTPPLSAVSKSCDPPTVSTPPPSPLLISDKSLTNCVFFYPFSSESVRTVGVRSHADVKTKLFRVHRFPQLVL